MTPIFAIMRFARRLDANGMPQAEAPVPATKADKAMRAFFAGQEALQASHEAAVKYRRRRQGPESLWQAHRRKD